MSKICHREEKTCQTAGSTLPFGTGKATSLIESGCPDTTTLLNLGHPKSTHCVTFEITREYEGHPQVASRPMAFPATSDIHKG
jgi:hypothetical protein